MIDLPQVNQQRLRTTPQVQQITSTPHDFGAGIGEGLHNLAGAAKHGMDVLAQVERRREAEAERAKAEAERSAAIQERLDKQRDAEAAESVYTDYIQSMGHAVNGKALPDGTLQPGLNARKTAQAEGVARDFARLEKEWMDNPQGGFAALTPQQQQIFEQKAARTSIRLHEQVAEFELGERQEQRKVERAVAAQGTAQLAADSYGTPQFEEFAQEAAIRAGDAAVGELMQVDHDSGKRTFATPAAREAHELERAAALEKLRIGQSRYFIDKARETDIESTAEIEGYIRAAEIGLDNLGPEAQTAVRNSIKDYRKSWISQLQGRKSDEHNARIEAQRVERERLDELEQMQMLDGYQELEAYYQALSESPESAYANVKIARAKSVEETRAGARQKVQKEVLTEMQAEQQRIAVNQLSLGAFMDPESKELINLSTTERRIVAYQAHAQGLISEPQFKAALKAADESEDIRVTQLTRQVLGRHMPSLALAVKRDEYGNFTISDALDSKDRRKFKLDQDSGIKRKWVNEDAWIKNKSENVFLGQVAQVLNTVKTRMSVDKNMTVEQAAEYFEKLIKGDLAEYNKVKLDKALQKENETLSVLERSLRKQILQRGDK